MRQQQGTLSAVRSCFSPLSDASARPMQRFHHRRRIVRGHLEQREGGTIGRATPLLPIAQRRDAHSNHQRELFLGLLQIRTYSLYVGGLERGGAGWFLLPAPDCTELPHAGEQLFKGFGFHLNSPRTTRASARSCFGDKSLSSFFAYM